MTELNLSCPNVPGKPQIAYDFETTEKILSEVFAYFTKPLIGIKLPPYFDMAHFDQAAAIFNKFPLSFVNCVNSIGNGIYIDDETVVIRPKMALAELVVNTSNRLPLLMFMLFINGSIPTIQIIIGTGGVLTGRDAFEHILCGAMYGASRNNAAKKV